MLKRLAINIQQYASQISDGVTEALLDGLVLLIYIKQVILVFPSPTNDNSRPSVASPGPHALQHAIWHIYPNKMLR